MVKKKIQFVVLALFTVMIIFFSLFGESLYSATKPKVMVAKPVFYSSADDSFYAIPKSAYIDGNVYLIESEAGFSVTLNRVVAVDVSVEEIEGFYNDMYRVVSGLSGGESIAGSSDKPLKDGMYVVVKTNVRL